MYTNLDRNAIYKLHSITMAKESLDKMKLVHIHNELILAEKRNENILLPRMRRNVARYTGDFIPDVGADWDIILNEVYPIVQRNIPSIFFRNPRVFLKPRNKTFIAKRRDPQTGAMRSVQLDSGLAARTQEALLNYAIQEIKYKNETRKVLFDALIAPHGVLWHGYKGEFGMTDEQSLFIKDEQVFVRRVSPLRFLFDPAVNISNLDEARWVARSFDIPLEDLLDDETLDVDTKQIKGFLGFGEKIKSDDLLQKIKTGGQDRINASSRLNSNFEPLVDFADSEFRRSNKAKFVTIYEIFMRPTKKERKDGSKGNVILMTKEQFKELRMNSWPYKAEGWPAKILQFNELPDSTFGLDDVSTYASIIDNKNIIRNLQLRNAQENSKVWVALAKDGQDETNIEKVQSGDQTIILFEGETVTGKMQVSSPSGGASNELYLIDGRMDKELQDKAFVSDLQKSILQSGEESATSVRERAAGGSVRPAFRQDLMSDFLSDSLHFLNQLLKQFMPYKEAVRIVGSLDIEWSENPTKEEIQADTDVELDVISMLPENPEKEARELQTILQLAIQSLTIPEVRQKIAQEGVTFNISPLIQQLLLRLKIRDPEVFRKIRQEESMGFASVAELRAAQENVQAAIQGQQPPSPPAEGQDHKARLAIYQSINQLLEALQQQSDVLTSLIQAQQAIAAEEEQRKAPKAGRSAPKASFSKQGVIAGI